MISIYVRLALGCALLFLDSLVSFAQTPATKHQPDVLILVDGEKLIGQFEKSIGGSVTFKSDLAGEITVDWKNVKELQSAQTFAIVKKDLKLHVGQQVDIPQGSITLADNNIQIHTAQTPAEVSVPVSDIGEVVNQSEFNKAVAHVPGFFEDWKGSATLGVAIVNATQSSQSYTSAVSVVRSIPTESWLLPSNRTTLSFNSTYGQLTQPNTPQVKTSLFLAEAERDYYLRPTLYAFGNAGFDHDYSQGLDLQQTYGGGIGWTALKSAIQELDLKGQVTFVDQQFAASASNQKLLGSIFSQSFNRTFRKKIVLHEQISLNPAWTVLRAYSANTTASLSIPVFKRLSFTVTTADEFLNDPSPGFRKNSYQFSTAITYTLP